MKDTRILRGSPNGTFSGEVLTKYIEDLGREIVSGTKGETQFAQYIIKSWSEQDGVYEIVFNQQALEYLKSIDDPRSDIVESLFAAFGDERVKRKPSPGRFANVKSPIGELTTPMAFIWLACTIVGPLLTYVDSPAVAQLGKGLMMMSLGYLLFGLGLQRSSPKSHFQNVPKKCSSRA